MTKFNETKMFATLAEDFKRGADAKKTLEQAVASINEQVQALRAHLKETKVSTKDFFKGNAKTNLFRRGLLDAFLQAGIADKTARNYMGNFITCVESNKKFSFGMSNGTDKKKTDNAPEATTPKTTEVEPNKVPTVGTSTTTPSAPVSEDGNNGADVQQKPSTASHQHALELIQKIMADFDQLVPALKAVNAHNTADGIYEKYTPLRDLLIEAGEFMADCMK